MVRVCALIEAGGVPGRNPLLAPLREELASDGVELVAWDPTGAFALPPHPPEADLYLLKGDHPAILSAAACLADAGARCLNGFEASAAAADKARTLARLDRAGLPVPASSVAGNADCLAALLAPGPRFVKPVRGAHGEGARLLGPGEAALAGPGPWLVQEPVTGNGYDLKVYGVGRQVAVRRARFTPGRVDATREPVERADPALARMAIAAAQTCELDCFGADFLVGTDGPVLVDLNAFPGYRGVDEAPAWLRRAILAALEETE